MLTGCTQIKNIRPSKQTTLNRPCYNSMQNYAAAARAIHKRKITNACKPSMCKTRCWESNIIWINANEIHTQDIHAKIRMERWSCQSITHFQYDCECDFCKVEQNTSEWLICAIRIPHLGVVCWYTFAQNLYLVIHGDRNGNLEISMHYARNTLLTHWIFSINKSRSKTFLFQKCVSQLFYTTNQNVFVSSVAMETYLGVNTTVTRVTVTSVGQLVPRSFRKISLTFPAAFLYLRLASRIKSRTRNSLVPQGTTTRTLPKQTVTFMMLSALILLAPRCTHFSRLRC